MSSYNAAVEAGASFDTQSLPEPFTNTAWTLISLAQQTDPDGAREHLGYLIERYWRPVYFFIRQRGNPHEDAKDLTQEFFAGFVEHDIIAYADQRRGKFRNFLLASVKRFLAQKYRAAARRPLEVTLTGIGTAEEFLAFEPAGGETPEAAFNRNWAKSLLETCVVRLDEECRSEGKDVHYRVFVGRLLREKPLPRRAIAEKLNISETDVDNYQHRAKLRFRRILREEILNCVQSSEEVDAEVQELFTILKKV